MGNKMSLDKHSQDPASKTNANPPQQQKEKQEEKIRGLARRKGEKNPYKWGFDIDESLLAKPYWRDGELFAK